MAKKCKYTEEHFQFIRDNVVNTEKDLHRMFNERFGLNVTLNAIENLKHKTGAKSGLVGGQFKKGSIPPNKGKTWDEYMSKEGQANSRKTTFKKGNIPANRSELGQERVDKDGYTMVKIQDGHLNKNWVLKHRLIFENHFGKIPDGYNVSFADGNKQNFDINNLILISRAEDAVMNKKKLFFDNSELTKTGHLIAKVLISASKHKAKEVKSE